MCSNEYMPIGDDIYTKVIISMTTFLYIIKSIFNYYINGVSKVITLTTIKTICDQKYKNVMQHTNEFRANACI